MNPQGDPSELANVGSAEEAWVFEKDVLQQIPYLETDSQLTFVCFQNHKGFSFDLKGRVAKRSRFGHAGKTVTNLPQAFQNRRFLQHSGMIRRFFRSRELQRQYRKARANAWE